MCAENGSAPILSEFRGQIPLILEMVTGFDFCFLPISSFLVIALVSGNSACYGLRPGSLQSHVKA